MDVWRVLRTVNLGIFVSFALFQNAAVLVSRGCGNGQLVRALAGTCICSGVGLFLCWTLHAIFKQSSFSYMQEMVTFLLGMAIFMPLIAVIKGKKKISVQPSLACESDEEEKLLAKPPGSFAAKGTVALALVAPTDVAAQLSAAEKTQKLPAAPMIDQKKGGSKPANGPQKSGGMSLWGTILVTSYNIFYIWFLVPHFKNVGATEKVILRLLLHPVVVVSGEMLLRHTASQPSHVPLHIKCMSMINFDQYFQLVGRFLIASQEGWRANAVVIVVAVQEFTMRISYIPKQRFVRRVLGLPPMNKEEQSRFLAVMAIDNASSMTSEMCAILIATACKLLLYDHRVLFDIDFEVNERPDIAAELTTCALAIVCEGISDFFAMVIQSRQGLALVGLLSGERAWEMAWWIVASQLFATAAVLFTFLARPVAWHCHCSNICGCSFAELNQILAAFCYCMEPNGIEELNNEMGRGNELWRSYQCP